MKKPTLRKKGLNFFGQLIEHCLNNNRTCLINNEIHTFPRTFQIHSLLLSCLSIILLHFNYSVINYLHCSDHFHLLLPFKNYKYPIYKPSYYIYDRANLAAFNFYAHITITWLKVTTIGQFLVLLILLKISGDTAILIYNSDFILEKKSTINHSRIKNAVLSKRWNKKHAAFLEGNKLTTTSHSKRHHMQVEL